MRYAVILAGGAGKRLWPMSRTSRPKQLLPLVEGQNLLELAVERLEGLFAPENIWVITNGEYAQQVAAALPGVPDENVVGEPEGRDTANAIALACEILSARDKDATMAVFTADHVIRPVSDFAEAVELACRGAEENPDALLTFGIRPNWPHTGLGYIHCGGSCRGGGIHPVLGFKEKPDHGTARRYVESGSYFWNSGMFVWRLGAISQALATHLPEAVQRFQPVRQALAEGRDFRPVLPEVYAHLPRISIDYAVMEKARKVLMVELKCQWLDVGSWPALESVTELDEAGNVIMAPTAAVLDCSHNILVSEDPKHLLAVMGVDDCIIVHTSDATLVCSKSDSQRLKELVERLEKRYGGQYI